ncbi:MAG: ATP-binding protein [Gemmatirosa sp.]
MPSIAVPLVAVVATGVAASALVWCASLLQLARRRARVIRELTQRVRALEAARETPATRTPSGTPSGTHAAAMPDVSAAEAREVHAQAQRLEVLGRVTAGVAHDFANLLTAIHGYADFLLADLPREDPLRDNAREIKRTATRASALTGQLLAFTRRREPQTRLLDLAAVVADTERMLHRLVGESVTLHVAPSDAPALVRADPGQLEQVLLNLVVNASDAMPDGGALTIGTHTLHAGAQSAPATAAGPLPPGAWVALTVRDTGVGMDAATQARIFEPFFTTKEAGHGTGLGLATVHDIVRDAGGAIGIASAPGGGTTFTIYLPEQAPADATLARATMATMRTLAPRGTETVLIVEDDEQVRGLFARVLQRYGYGVLEARDAGEALRLADAHAGGALALALVDVGLPGGDGRALAAMLAARHPDVAVRLMTGYTDDELARRGGLPDGASSPLRKPVAPPVLLTAVRETLDARSAATALSGAA